MSVSDLLRIRKDQGLEMIHQMRRISEDMQEKGYATIDKVTWRDSISPEPRRDECPSRVQYSPFLYSSLCQALQSLGYKVSLLHSDVVSLQRNAEHGHDPSPERRTSVRVLASNLAKLRAQDSSPTRRYCQSSQAMSISIISVQSSSLLHISPRQTSQSCRPPLPREELLQVYRNDEDTLIKKTARQNADWTPPDLNRNHWRSTRCRRTTILFVC